MAVCRAWGTGLNVAKKLEHTMEAMVHIRRILKILHDPPRYPKTGITVFSYTRVMQGV